MPAPSSHIPVFALAVAWMAAAAAAEVRIFGTAGANIPDNDPAGIAADVHAPVNGTITEVRAAITLNHTWVGDLHATLTHVETGTTVVLLDRPGHPASPSGCSLDDIAAVFQDDPGLVPAEDFCAAFPYAIYGEVQPLEALAAFVGEDAGGTWRFVVSDRSANELGYFVACTVEIHGNVPNAVGRGCPRLAIPDNSPTGISRNISGGGGYPTLDDLNLHLRIDHTWIGDLQVELEHVPSGTTAIVIDRIGVPASSATGCSGNDIEVVLDDEAATTVEDTCLAAIPAASGHLRPATPLSVFDGFNPGDSWDLHVRDLGNLDVGQLVSWALAFNECTVMVCGDCNASGAADILDALLAAQHAAGVVVLAGTAFSSCNVTGALEPDLSASVDVLDSLRIGQAAAGLPVSLVCCP